MYVFFKAYVSCSCVLLVGEPDLFTVFLGNDASQFLDSHRSLPWARTVRDQQKGLLWVGCCARAVAEAGDSRWCNTRSREIPVLPDEGLHPRGQVDELGKELPALAVLQTLELLWEPERQPPSSINRYVSA